MAVAAGRRHVIKYAPSWPHLGVQQSPASQAALRGHTLLSNVVQMCPVYSQHANTETLKKKLRRMPPREGHE